VFAERDLLDERAWNVELADEVFAQHAHATKGYRAHRKLRVSGNAQLANEKDVERGAKRARDFARHGNAAAGQREHDHVWAVRICTEVFGELPSAVSSIAETHGFGVVHSATGSPGIIAPS
jgi:hypothetical protein